MPASPSRFAGGPPSRPPLPKGSTAQECLSDTVDAPDHRTPQIDLEAIPETSYTSGLIRPETDRGEVPWIASPKVLPRPS